MKIKAQLETSSINFILHMLKDCMQGCQLFIDSLSYETEEEQVAGRQATDHFIMASIVFDEIADQLNDCGVKFPIIGDRAMEQIDDLLDDASTGSN